MIKKWNRYILEFVDNSNSMIDAKMQEISDLVNSISQSQAQAQDQSISSNLIYEWENKNDHDLIVNFTKDNLAIKYEFSIDDLYITKYAGDSIDFEKSVKSVDEGLDIIEKDIQFILGISEKKINNVMKFKYLKEYKNFNRHPENSYDLDPNDKERISRKEMEKRLIDVSSFDESDLKAMNDSEVKKLYHAMEVDATADKEDDKEIDKDIRD
jgi:hypothetical protein